MHVQPFRNSPNSLCLVYGGIWIVSRFSATFPITITVAYSYEYRGNYFPAAYYFLGVLSFRNVASPFMSGCILSSFLHETNLK